MKYITLFILIQLVSFVLTVVGVPLCAYLAYFHGYTYDASSGQSHWPSWAWLWDNEEDGILPTWYHSQHDKWIDAHVMFIWSAFRNSCNNLRFVKRLLWLPISVSKVGRPIWYWTKAGMRVYSITIFGRTFRTPSQIYIKWGWMSNGYPAASQGGGRGY